MNLNEIYTVEYSVVQKCYHVTTLDDTLRNNIEAVERESENQFSIIGFFKDYDSASDFVDYHRNRRNMSRVVVNKSGMLNDWS